MIIIRPGGVFIVHAARVYYESFQHFEIVMQKKSSSCILNVYFFKLPKQSDQVSFFEIIKATNQR